MKKLTMREFTVAILNEYKNELGKDKIEMSQLLFYSRYLVRNIFNKYDTSNLPYDQLTFERFVLENEDMFEYEQHFRIGDDYIKYSKRVNTAQMYKVANWVQVELKGIISKFIEIRKDSVWDTMNLISYQNDLVKNDTGVYEYIRWMYDYFIRNVSETSIIEERDIHYVYEYDVDSRDFNHIRHLSFFVDNMLAYFRSAQIKNVGDDTKEAYIFKIFENYFEIGRKDIENDYRDYIKIVPKCEQAVDVIYVLFKVAPKPVEYVPYDDDPFSHPAMKDDD